MRITAGRLLTAADLAATFLFAVEGALIAAAVGLDLFGIMVIGFVSSLVGGIIRDVLIGYTPPASLRGAWYPTVAFTGAALVFLLHQSGAGEGNCRVPGAAERRRRGVADQHVPDDAADQRTDEPDHHDAE